MIFTTFGIEDIIQTLQIKHAHTAYKLKEKDRDNILIKFFFYIPFENMKKFGAKKLIFSDGGGNPPPPGT